MYQRPKNKKDGHAYVNRKAEQSAPVTAQASSNYKYGPAQRQREQQHGKPRPRQSADWIIPTI